MATSPVTTIIHKSFAGVLFIWLCGLIATALLGYAAYLNGFRYGDPLGRIYALAALLTICVTSLLAYVYRLSEIRLDDTGMTVINYSSLFAERTAECLYRNIVDVDLRKTGILSAIGGYGTLYVQTAGTERNLLLTFVPEPERWTAYLLHQSRQARTPVTET